MPDHITCPNCGARIALPAHESEDACHVVACPECGIVTDYGEEDVQTQQPTRTPEYIPEKMRHFLDLARRGSQTGASSGERRARALADTIAQYAPELDDEAIDGLCQFARHAKFFPASAPDLY
jgi:hypothetical protein